MCKMRNRIAGETKSATLAKFTKSTDKESRTMMHVIEELFEDDTIIRTYFDGSLHVYFKDLDTGHIRCQTFTEDFETVDCFHATTGRHFTIPGRRTIYRDGEPVWNEREEYL